MASGVMISPATTAPATCRPSGASLGSSATGLLDVWERTTRAD